MSGTCIGLEICASVRHVWDMHWHGYMCQCKTCQGHGIDTDG
ncbi:hypothetical protein F383_27090 [Gossypium arboreum]|uniref:Uncharacterized protein n=1 Tax=Gossypium arboreum TaxID=29729 RepID=A0A0B0P7U7_GOSAR|nr:hypothetical protein F383_27090 [Gossypium arboreum]